ncbi:polysaccharide export protein [Horticoccus luteus]|uniref:Polysaccharide export protein n=1 Tax=Horticoccus luteus TaxID=2862869 RepID=A0A8F9TV61_9BACT|nr:polysaccharide biosynthesis/export family protein [Horticoccus luteus]QYM78576.1 polysaccharide export protein [Horticoccus luteus]
MRFYHHLIALAAFSVGLLNLRAAPASAPATAAPAASETATSADYIVHASDLLRVQVFQEDDLTRDVRVSQDMTISLPLIGNVNVLGRTVRDIEENVRQLYDRDYLVNPQINVIVLDYGHRTVNVLGMVNSPGAIQFPQEKGLNLLDAISLAGGFTRLADRKHVKLTRARPDGRVENFTINADDLIQGATSDQWVLTKDDTVFVPERIL